MQYGGGLQESARASWRKRHLRGGKSADGDGKRDDGGDTTHPSSIRSARPSTKLREAQSSTLPGVPERRSRMQGVCEQKVKNQEVGESECQASAWIWNFSGHQITCSLLLGHPGPRTGNVAAPFLPCMQRPTPAGPVLALQVTLDTLPSPPPPQRAAGPLPTPPPTGSLTRHTEPEFVLRQDKGWIWQYYLKILVVLIEFKNSN